MWFRQLDSAIILEVSGRDAPRYLNSRLTQNIKALTVGGATLGAALSPQGRCEGLFSVFRKAADIFLLICDGGNKEEVTNAFKRYIVADQVKVVLRDDLKLIHIADCTQQPTVSADGVTFFINHRITQGFDLLVPADTLDQVLVELGSLGISLSSERFRTLRIKSGVPAFPEEINDKALFSECGVVSAVAFNKGCYVGQEVIEKVEALGKAPKRLFLLSFDGDATVIEGESVKLGDAAIGKVISCVYDSKDAKSYALAVLKNDTRLLNAHVTAASIIGQVQRQLNL